MDIDRQQPEPPPAGGADLDEKDERPERLAKRKLPIIVDEISCVVKNGAVTMTFYRLKDMRRMAMNDVDAAFDGGVGEAAEPARRRGTHIRPPMQRKYDQVGAGLPQRLG